ncbi:MAG TPA: LapA family protein [Burkholderiales bacterium]|nr:LapA family protein [Burkholderiales bacterium]
MKRLLLLIVGVPVLLFILQNFQTTELRFLTWRIAMPHALLLIFVLAAGILIGWALRALLAERSAKDENRTD